MGIVDFFVVLGIGVGLYRRRERARAWLRRRGAGGSMFRGLPDLLGRCLEDVRSLGDDLLALLSPEARRRIEERTRTIQRRVRSRLAGTPRRSREPGTRAGAVSGGTRPGATR